MNHQGTIIVTGGAGYIGSHVCKALAQDGWLPVAFDNLSAGHREAVRWGPLEVGDLRDAKRVEELIVTYRPQGVIHLASLTSVSDSTMRPMEFFDTNCLGTMVLLRSLQRHGVRNFIYSSTAAVYGTPDRTPIPEEHPCRPISPYGTSKHATEIILRDLATFGALNTISLRYFNAAGADPDAEIGENHDPETHLIPLVLQTALGMRPAISIFGTQFETPDGTCIRDYVHVSDLARAHVLALHALLAGTSWDVFNLGNGQGFSVREVIDIVRAVTGRPIDVHIAPPRAGDAAVLVANASRAMRDLRWQPQFGELATIIETAWRWMQKLAAARPA